MTSAPLTIYADFARLLADEAGHIARRHFRTPITADIKADNSPVTIADREIERMIRERLAAQFPDHGILGEEEASIRTDAEYVWTIDPIDGTKSFIGGRALFTTLIGLTHHDIPVVGVVDQPITHDRWIGVKGMPADFNHTACGTRSCASLSEAMLATTSPYLFNDADRKAFESVRTQCRDTYLDGDAYAYGLLASGFLDIVIEANLKPYDFCPLVPLIETAGGIITDWQGEPLTIKSHGQVLACGDKNRHTDILQLIGG